jgi:ribosomal protein S18 acetylase RimI-like enzyme
MTRVAIRRAGVADAEAVLAMVRELAEHQDEGQYVTGDLASWSGLLGREDVVVLVAEQDGRAVGYVSALRRPHLWSGTDVLALDDLYVRPAGRDGGVGRSLMLALARYAEPDRLTIAWGVRPDNLGAQRFYERLGAVLRDKVVCSWDAATYSTEIRK